MSCWECEGSCRGVPGVVNDLEELVGSEEADRSWVRLLEEEDRSLRAAANI